LKRYIGGVVRAILGPRHTWDYRKSAIQESQNIEARLADAFTWISEKASRCDEQPVFLFSAGWRSGSTLLQRMVMQNNSKIVIWGEPYNLCNIFDGLANQFRAFTASWPKEIHFLSKIDRSKLSDQWVANLYPDVDDLLHAHRQFLNALFAQPAYRFGGGNWGMKVVRLNIDHAIYLRRLYPKGKFIFLCRDPFASYASFRKIYDGWFAKWPDRVVATPYSYGKHWATLTQGFLDGYESLGGIFIRYEDLDDERRCDQLGGYLGWEVSRASSLTRIVGGLGGEAGDRKPRMPAIERGMLSLAVRTVRKHAGY
jgi:hypothetical protein